MFLADVDAAMLAELRRRVEPLVEAGTDKVHIVPECQACWDKVEVLGLGEKPEDPEFYLV